MPSLNFKRQFAEAVANGTKRQTIRARGKRAWKVGDHLAIHVGGRVVGTATCCFVKDIILDTETPEILLRRNDGSGEFRRLNEDEMLELAKKDGFDTLSEFLAYYSHKYGSRISGQLILW